MPVHDRLGSIPGLPESTEFKHEPPPQPTPEQIAVFRAQITEEAKEKDAVRDRNAEDARIIKAMELRAHNLHVLFMNDLAILEANVKGPEKVDQVRGRTVLTIDINMTAVPHNPILIWERPCVIAATNECVDIHLDGHAPRPGELGYDPLRPGRVYLEFAVPSFEDVPILAFHHADDAIFSLVPFRDLELPPLGTLAESPETLKVPAPDKEQPAEGFDPHRESGARPGAVAAIPEDTDLKDTVPGITIPPILAASDTVLANPVPAVPAPSVEVPLHARPTTEISFDAGTRIQPFFQSHASLVPGAVGDLPSILLPPVLPRRETPAFPPVDGAPPAFPVRVEGGTAPFATPVPLSLLKSPVTENPTPPTPTVEGTLVLRVEGTPPAVPPAIPAVGHTPVRPAAAPDTAPIPGIPTVDGIVLRIEPARPEERAWAFGAESVPLETRSFVSSPGPEVRPMTNVEEKPQERRDTGHGGDKEGANGVPDVNAFVAAGLRDLAGRELFRFDAAPADLEPARPRYGAESLAQEVVGMVDRLLVTAEPGSYVKELRMTMNPLFMPGTEILMRMVGQSLTVTFLNKDGNMGKELAEEVPVLEASLRAHLGENVEIRILTGDEGATQ